MRTRFLSLRIRFLSIAAGIVIVALFATGVGLTELFERHAIRRVGQELDVYLNQLTGSVRFGENGDPSLVRYPSDPRFSKVFGGLYWQIRGNDKKILLRSRSLWDAEIDLPDDVLAPGDIHQHTASSQFSRALLIRERRISVPAENELFDLRISVAIDAEEIETLAAGFRSDLIPALSLLGLVLMAGFGFQIAAGLKPLRTLRTSVNDVRSGRQARLNTDVPTEVEPLVSEVNSLLELQNKTMIRARDRAADLAHGLKTPLTALATDVERLRQKGELEIAADIEDVASRMRRHMDRELAQARIRHGGYGHKTALKAGLDAIIRTVSRTPLGAEIAFEVDVPDDAVVAMDQDDLYEVIGNLIENAVRHARRRVRVNAVMQTGRAIVTIEDDGKGLRPEKSRAMMERGQRLDARGAGAGLGLAIVQDILGASNGSVALGSGLLGGLQVRLDLPLAR